MSDVLKQVYNACDPYKPATAEYYLDCAKARGSSALTQEFQRRLALANDHLCFLFTGHIGCGKSSELRQLQHALEYPTLLNARYLPVLLDVSDYLDERDVDTADLLLAIVTELADTLREKVEVELQDNYFGMESTRLCASCKSSKLLQARFPRDPHHEQQSFYDG